VRSLALTALEEEIAARRSRACWRRSPRRRPQAGELPLDLPLREARDAFERIYFEFHLQLEAAT
jgi:two-component system nitrogen regulation response regulator NtrX